MKPRGLSICYYPSTIVFVDDDPTLLQAVTEQVQDYAPCVAFTQADEAIAYIRSRAGKPALSLPEGESVNENLIYQSIYNTERYSDLALVVVDYQMPRKNGIQIAEAIHDLGIPVVLLTGEVDELVAVEAFNEDLIDAYFKKSTENLAERLAHKIFELQMRHALDRSLNITSVLSDRKIQPLSSCFHDRAFISFFKHFLRTSQFVEYYLYRCPGDFLLLDRAGQPTWFVVRERREMDLMKQKIVDAHGRDFKTMEEQTLLLELDHYQRIAFFSHPSVLDGSIEDWTQYLYPCQQIESEEGKLFYYALVPYQHFHTAVESEKVSGFDQYMTHHRIDAAF
jgi:CheY-like chemotaxis protein